MSILAASRGDQVAGETDRGIFSNFLGGALEGGAADVLGKVTIAGLYSYLDESFGAWNQRPAFKANVDRLHELRRCTPAVPLTELRQICELFPAAGHLFELDPSYEPSAEPRDPEHERVFSTLQKYRAAKLVSRWTRTTCTSPRWRARRRLTPLGRHYWQVAKEGRL